MRRSSQCRPDRVRAGWTRRNASPVSTPLGARLDGRDNALNFLRLVLASAVIVGHAYPLGGHGASRIEGLSGLAVDGFFALSGFLIAGSRMRLPMHDFLLRRCLRILPGFWACLVVTAFVFAPLSSLFVGRLLAPPTRWGTCSTTPR